MKDFINFIDPSLINDKKVAIIGAGNLEVPLLIDSLFSPKSIDAVDTDIWRENFYFLKQKASSGKLKINLYPLVNFSLKELISTGATPWDIIFSCIYFEAYENPIELIESMALLTTNALLLYTHISIESRLPIMISHMVSNRVNHTGIFWQLSEKFIDTHLQFIGLYKASDLVELKKKYTYSRFKFLKHVYKTSCITICEFCSKKFISCVYKILDPLLLRKVNTPESVEIVKTLKKLELYCKLWKKS